MYRFAESPESEKPSEGRPTALDEVVARLNAGDQSSVAGLISMLERGVAFFLHRSLGETEQNAQIARQILLRAAQRALDGRLTTGREMSRCVLELVREEARDDVARHPQRLEPAEIRRFSTILKELPERDREVLERLYHRAQSPGVICRELGITQAQLSRIQAQARKSCGREDGGTVRAATAGGL